MKGGISNDIIYIINAFLVVIHLFILSFFFLNKILFKRTLRNKKVHILHKGGKNEKH
jgi:hypothetical protein